jgi:ABC-type uncharacterized transport system ATPase component
MQAFHRLRSRASQEIAVVGGTGAGKSSLICALIGQTGVAIVGAFGIAVTRHPVTYRARVPENHKQKYIVRVSFPSRRKIMRRAKGILDNLNPQTTYSAEELDAMLPEEKQVLKAGQEGCAR